ncbi:MAG: hypothetical protein ACK5RG_21745 [Cyclobacteriaceae bacterium]|jgi:hypothetical protein
MKIGLAVIISMVSITCYGQEWASYQVDSMLTVSLPGNIEEMDSLGQRLISAYVDNGIIFINVRKNEGELAFNMSNEKELLACYKGFQRGYTKSITSKMIKQEIIDQHGLKLSRFSCRAMMGDEVQLRHCLCVFLKGKVYSINFWELESATNEMTEVREKFFASVILPIGLTIEDQFNDRVEGSLAYKVGYYVGYIGVLILFLGGIVGVIVWVVRRNQKKQSPEF